jgi:hypothetical protein
MFYTIRMRRKISHINGMCYRTKNKKGRVIEKQLVATSTKISVIDQVTYFKGCHFA